MKKWSVIFLVIMVIGGAFFANQTSTDEEAFYLVQTFEFQSEDSIQRFKYYDKNGNLIREHLEKGLASPLDKSSIDSVHQMIYQYDSSHIVKTNIKTSQTEVTTIFTNGTEGLNDFTFDDEGNRYDLKSLMVVGGPSKSTVYKNNEELFSIAKSYAQIEYNNGYFYLLFDVVDPVIDVYDEKGVLKKSISASSMIKINNYIYAVTDLGHTLKNLNTGEILYSNQPILDNPVIKTYNNQIFLTYPNSNTIYQLNIKDNQITFETLYSKENSRVEMSFVTNEWIVYQRDNINNQIILDVVDENGFKEQKKIVVELETNELICHVYKLR